MPILNEYCRGGKERPKTLKEELDWRFSWFLQRTVDRKNSFGNYLGTMAESIVFDVIMETEKFLHTIHNDILGVFGESFDFGRCVFNVNQNNHSFFECYVGHNALAVGVSFTLALIAYSFIWSVIGQNVSKVDQIWSITPFMFCWHFFYHSYALGKGKIHYRLLFVALLTTLWGFRLTYNFWRKGGYGNFFQHEEDYRWPILRAKMHPIVFQLFNFGFIAVYQNFLLFWIAVPAYEVSRGPHNLGEMDIQVGVLFALLLIFETVCDEQHWVYQQYKHSLTAAEREKHPDVDVKNGFYASGMFRYSRHPNYFAEQLMWVCVYLFSITPLMSRRVDLVKLLNWTGLGCVQLILLFQGSISFGESITVSKYPAYKEYQKVTSMLMPWPFTRKDYHAAINKAD
jgi:steroid 5-alpha reductase family enzyme